MRRALLLFSFAVAALAPGASRAGDAAADEAAIRASLAAWTQDFNRGDAAATCALFADDLKSDMQGAAAGDKAAVCGRISRALAPGGGRLAYALDIHEVLVSGDLAAVRLTWTLTDARDGGRLLSRDEGLDIFRRDPDGSWRIARYMAFPVAGEDAPGAGR